MGRNKVLKVIHSVLNGKAREIVDIIIMFIILICVNKFLLKESLDYFQFFEMTIATSLIITYFITLIIKFISHYIEQKIEDSLKLGVDYNNLVKQYKNEHLIRYNIGGDPEQLEIYPAVVVHEVLDEGSLNLEIEDDPNRYYELPRFIENNFIELFSSHKHSSIFNALNIRLDKILIDDIGKVQLCTSRTTYFNSLVTNRVMDKELLNGLTLRSIYEYGNKLSSLEDSRLSNHIGFNGIVETSDNKFIFVSRFKNVSIGKNTLGCSISASLKTKYAIDPQDELGSFNLNGLERGIIKEIEDELAIKQESNLGRNYDFDISKNIIAIYRDLVEGGKPQLLFYIKSKLDSAKIEANFKNREKNKNEEGEKGEESNYKDQKKLLTDGSKLLFFEPGRIVPKVDAVIYTGINGRGKKYAALPSTTASIALVLKYIERTGEDCG